MLRITLATLSLLLLFCVTPQIGLAACSGTSPSLTAPTWADVAACHTSASTGDTITVTSGSYTATTTTTITKYVTLKAAAGGVTVTDNTPGGDPGSGGGGDLLSITESTAGSTRLQGFTFQQGTGVHTGAAAMVGLLFASGGKPILVTGNTFAQFTSGNAMHVTTNRGVIWQNTYTGTMGGAQCFGNTSVIRHKPGGGTWFSPHTWGTADTDGQQNLYFENNTIVDVFEGLDADDGARLISRFNSVTNSGALTHGDTSFPGGRYLDAYKNTLIRDGSDKCGPGIPVNQNGWMNWRAGTGHWMDNTIANLDSGYWGVKTEIRFSVDGLTRSLGSGCSCYTGTYPYPAQTGWGYISGGTTAGSTCYGTVMQDLQPIYIAGNTGTFDGVGAQDYGECGTQSVFAYAVENREWYKQAGGAQTSATSPFNGSSGTGYGPRSLRPTTCTTGVAYWSQDQGSWNTSGTTGGGSTLQGVLDVCTATNTWTNGWYTPYTYPHPLTAGTAAAGAPHHMRFAK